MHPPPSHPPFRPPCGPSESTGLTLDRDALAARPSYTALWGHVFDMQDARPKLQCVIELFGGRDTTLFHLHRHDDTTGDETIEDLRQGRVSRSAREYLNAYLHEYAREFRWVGRYDHGPTPPRRAPEQTPTRPTTEPS